MAPTDAAFIVALRNQDFARGFVNSTAASVSKQAEWIRNYLARAGDYYWVIEDPAAGGKAVGTIGLYHAQPEQAEVGRWIMLPGTGFPVIAPTLLTYAFAFEQLQLPRIVFCVVSGNKKVLRFHRLLGEPETHVERHALQIDGVWVDLVWFAATRSFWQENRARWEAFAV